MTTGAKRSTVYLALAAEAALFAWLWLSGRGGSGLGGAGAGATGSGHATDEGEELPRTCAVIWLHGDNQVRVDGVETELADALSRARLVDHVELHVTGMPTHGFVLDVIEELCAAAVDFVVYYPPVPPDRESVGHTPSCRSGVAIHPGE